jgi:hypothetical protein
MSIAKPTIVAENRLFQNDSRGLGGESGVLGCIIVIKLSLQDRLEKFAEQNQRLSIRGSARSFSLHDHPFIP